MCHAPGLTLVCTWWIPRHIHRRDPGHRHRSLRQARLWPGCRKGGGATTAERAGARRGQCRSRDRAVDDPDESGYGGRDQCALGMCPLPGGGGALCVGGVQGRVSGGADEDGEVRVWRPAAVRRNDELSVPQN